MSFSYIFILVGVLVLSPFILTLASSQNKKSRNNLRLIFIGLLATQILAGFLNWETFKGTGRSGFELSLAYPDSFLGLFFITSLLQIILLLFNKSFKTTVVVLNFINSVLIFAGMIRISSSLSYQTVSFASVGAVFLVLVGNVIALVFINKDKNLLKKYPWT